MKNFPVEAVVNQYCLKPVCPVSPVEARGLSPPESWRIIKQKGGTAMAPPLKLRIDARNKD
jgi:hypothetical protein